MPDEAQEQVATVKLNPQPSIEETQGSPPAATITVEQPKEREQEPPVGVGTDRKLGIVDIASLLGAPTVTVVQLTL